MAVEVAEPDARAEDAKPSLIAAAAGLSFAAALIHASVIVAHFRDYWLFGLFFVIVAVLQLGWAGAVWTRRDDRALLLAGAIGNLAVAAVWLWSRTVGLPIGPDSGSAEVAGVHDLFATADEIAIAIAVGASLTVYAARRPPAVLLSGLWLLAAASGISAFLGSHTA